MASSLLHSRHTPSRYRMTREDKARRHEARKMADEQQRQNRPGMKELIAEEKAREKVKEKAKLKRNKNIKSGVKHLIRRVGPVGLGLVTAYDLAKGRMPVVENFKNIKALKRGKMKPTIETIEGTPKETKNKKHGGKVKGYKKGGAITYRMTGGQVVDNSYD